MNSKKCRLYIQNSENLKCSKHQERSLIMVHTSHETPKINTVECMNASEVRNLQ